MTLPDYVYSTYNALLSDGWKMQDIDGMDMIGFIKVRAWNARKKNTPKKKKAYIDQVWRSDL